MSKLRLLETSLRNEKEELKNRLKSQFKNQKDKAAIAAIVDNAYKSEVKEPAEKAESEENEGEKPDKVEKCMQRKADERKEAHPDEETDPNNYLEACYLEVYGKEAWKRFVKSVEERVVKQGSKEWEKKIEKPIREWSKEREKLFRDEITKQAEKLSDCLQRKSKHSGEKASKAVKDAIGKVF